MAETEPWLNEPTQDKLNIFVSSRIKECEDERTIAQKSILGVNHNPVLFEHLGARSIKARHLYLSRLANSQIVLGIYRLGYGYIDTSNGMTVSGLEDELLHAEKLGIPTLVYVLESGEERDERLSELISRLASQVTIYFYSSPEELETRIRDDLSAEITRQLLRPGVAPAGSRESAGQLLERVAKQQGGLINRIAVLNDIQELAKGNPLVCVHGLAGIGKTTLSAQFARENQAQFVASRGMTPLDLFSACAKALNPDVEGDFTFATLSGARLGFSSAWAEADTACLVIDECEFIEELIKAVDLAGGTSLQKSIIVTSRTPLESFVNFEVPVLSTEEAKDLIAARGISSVPEEDGISTPLQVQSLAAEAEANATGLSVRAREISSYLCLSPIQLSAADISQLLGDDATSIEDIYESIGQLGALVDDSPAGFRLMHEESARNLLEQLRATPQKLRFYANRLVQLFQARSSAILSYKVASLLDDSSREQFALAAIREAGRLGDWKLGCAVAKSQLEGALDAERRSDAFQLMLMLVYPMELMGELAQAEELLKSAEAIAPELGDDEVALVTEVKLASQARRTLLERDVDGLERIRDAYRERGQAWDQARIGLEISALYIASKNYERSVELLRESLTLFRDCADDYGVDLVERNLASALAALPGNDAEVDALLEKIEDRASRDHDSRRQRAWYCNLLTRRYRNAGRLTEAEGVALESIELSEALGDESLKALNYVNLGNVYSDAKDLDKALKAYDEAGRLAQHCGRRDIEADASRLRAGILNDFPELAESVPDRHQQAKVFASHAIGLLKDTIYHEARARAYLEVADAEDALGETQNASFSYFDAASEFRRVPDNDAFWKSISVGSGYALEVGPEIYLEKLSEVVGTEVDNSEALGDQFLELIEPIIEQCSKKRLVRMLGRHVRTLHEKLPQLLRPAILRAIADAVTSRSVKQKALSEPWRMLYSGLVAPYLSASSQASFAQRHLAAEIAKTLPGIDVRILPDTRQLWTVTLQLDRAITLTIEPMDDSSAAEVGAQSLAFFLKAFEKEISELIQKTETTELHIQIASYDNVPPDIREMANRMFDVDATLDEQSVAVTRTNDFSGETPTFVFLHLDFVERSLADDGMVGSLQSLFALTLVELLFQCLHGEVDYEELRPKVLSLVRRTLS